MMQRWDQLDHLLSQCRKDEAFRKNFCTTPLLFLMQFIYNHSTLFALFSGLIAAFFFDGWLWIISILVALALFVFLPLGITWMFKRDTL